MYSNFFYEIHVLLTYRLYNLLKSLKSAVHSPSIPLVSLSSILLLIYVVTIFLVLWILNLFLIKYVRRGELTNKYLNIKQTAGKNIDCKIFLCIYIYCIMLNGFPNISSIPWLLLSLVAFSIPMYLYLRGSEDKAVNMD